jgi:hypothetical protein
VVGVPADLIFLGIILVIILAGCYRAKNGALSITKRWKASNVATKSNHLWARPSMLVKSSKTLRPAGSPRRRAATQEGFPHRARFDSTSRRASDALNSGAPSRTPRP